jgi:hypothetical protein
MSTSRIGRSAFILIVILLVLLIDSYRPFICAHLRTVSQ